MISTGFSMTCGTSLILITSIGFSTTFSIIFSTVFQITSGSVSAWVDTDLLATSTYVDESLCAFGWINFWISCFYNLIWAHLSLSPFSIPTASRTNVSGIELAKSSIIWVILPISGEISLISWQQVLNCSWILISLNSVLSESTRSAKQ